MAFLPRDASDIQQNRPLLLPIPLPRAETFCVPSYGKLPFYNTACLPYPLLPRTKQHTCHQYRPFP